MKDLRTCAAVYGQKDAPGRIHEIWLDAALAFLSDYGLPVREYEINQTPSSVNEFLYAWPKDRDRLLTEVEGEHIRELGLYAHPDEKKDLVPWWHGHVHVNLNRSYLFLGLLATLAIPPAELMRAADQLASLFTPLRYGISYLFPMCNGPHYYAVGIASNRTTNPRERQSREIKSQLRKWQDDYLTKQSYLYGSFRDVYPANLLSDAHVRAALPGGKTLETLGIGRLSPMGPDKWLWEVSDDEISPARAVLSDAGLLICA